MPTRRCCCCWSRPPATRFIKTATRWVAAYDGAATGIVFSALIGSLAITAVWPPNLFDLALFISLRLIGGGGHYLLIRAFL